MKIKSSMLLRICALGLIALVAGTLSYTFDSGTVSGDEAERVGAGSVSIPIVEDGGKGGLKAIGGPTSLSAPTRIAYWGFWLRYSPDTISSDADSTSSISESLIRAQVEKLYILFQIPVSSCDQILFGASSARCETSRITNPGGIQNWYSESRHQWQTPGYANADLRKKNQH